MATAKKGGAKKGGAKKGGGAKNGGAKKGGAKKRDRIAATQNGGSLCENIRAGVSVSDLSKEFGPCVRPFIFAPYCLPALTLPENRSSHMTARYGLV